MIEAFAKGRWAIGLVLAAAAAGVFMLAPSRAEEGIAIPAPREDMPAGSTGVEVAVLAGGCFWGVQGVFQHVDGVLNAVSGYAGGDAATAHYEMVGTGATGHAEAVEVIFDPRRISYGRILQVFFSVAHDPTQLNRQGPDVGTQYRSAIFPASPAQAEVARAYIEDLDAARLWRRPIVTTIEADATFHPAEGYHQDFMTLNPDYPYIVFNDRPKVANLQRLYPDLWREDPLLVSEAALTD
jgi:peptide-methionine (S)-S-oxide reductase